MLGSKGEEPTLVNYEYVTIHDLVHKYVSDCCKSESSCKVDISSVVTRRGFLLYLRVVIIQLRFKYAHDLIHISERVLVSGTITINTTKSQITPL